MIDEASEPQDLSSEPESELPDIPELDEIDSNPEELTIELEEPAEPVEPEEPAEPAEPAEPVELEIKEVNEPEEPDAGFPLPEEPDEDSIIDEGDAMDSESDKEGSNLEPETVREAGEESSGQDKDEANELDELKSVDIEII